MYPPVARVSSKAEPLTSVANAARDTKNEVALAMISFLGARKMESMITGSQGALYPVGWSSRVTSKVSLLFIAHMLSS